MPKKILQKFCRITKYLEQIDPDLYQTMEDLCLLGLFRSGRQGVTFLYPAEKTYRAKIVSSAYSNTPEKAVEMLKSLVLTEYLPTLSAFSKGVILNKHGNVLEVDTKGKTVKLSSGQTVECDKKFKQLRSDGNASVCIVKGKGVVPVGKPSKGGKVRGGAHRNTLVDNPCRKMAMSVEDIYQRYLDNPNNNNADRHVYKIVVYYLLLYISTNDPSIKSVIGKKICASARASFYNIVRPYNLNQEFNLVEVVKASGLPEIGNLSSTDLSNLYNTASNDYNRLIGSFKDTGSVSDDDRENIREKTLKSIKNATDARLQVVSAYREVNTGGDSSPEAMLYKDLLTVYCYMAAMNEGESPEYFKYSFRYAMKYIFNHNNSFCDSINETVYNLTLYYNLLKSDAFLYTPRAALDSRYDTTDVGLPEPSSDKLFSIQFGSVFNEKRGGVCGGWLGGMLDKSSKSELKHEPEPELKHEHEHEHEPEPELKHEHEPELKHENEHEHEHEPESEGYFY